MTNQEYIQKIADGVIEGDAEAAAEATRAAVEAGIDPLEILNVGLMGGADVVGKLFERGEYFLPELMLAGRALKAAMEIVKPKLLEQYAGGATQVRGKAIAATVQSDIHDIGKNIVASMLTASGFEVIDLGVDVPIKTIIDKAEELGAQFICCSALLTTSMPFIKDLIELLKARGLREKYIVLVGGASVSEEWARKVGADGTARNAADAVQLARRLLEERVLQAV